jgi:hypothetical protein
MRFPIALGSRFHKFIRFVAICSCNAVPLSQAEIHEMVLSADIDEGGKRRIIAI